MRSKGLSLSFNYIILALIGITVAFAIVSAFTGNFGTFSEFVGGSISDSQMQLANQHCVQEFRRLCKEQAVYSDSSEEWADDATFQGETCRYYIEQGALGGEVRTCGDTYGGY